MKIRWNSEEKARKVKALAQERSRGSVNRLVNAWADAVLTAEAAEASFRAAASRGNPERLIRVLEEVDRQDRAARIAGPRP